MVQSLKLLFLAGTCLASIGCSPLLLNGEQTVDAVRTPCHIVFDAGSSGTRVSIYEKNVQTWNRHSGPKTKKGLADPVRGIRGMSWNDREAVAESAVALLEAILEDGPDDQGRPKWNKFDWPTRCRVVSASVYATAGMRIAEYENGEWSQELWALVHEKLKEKLKVLTGRSIDLIDVNARTLSGYEEGLFTWLAVREELKMRSFGIVELGGASVQVAFPCPGDKCDAFTESVRRVGIEGVETKIFSRSFLGLGQDEASKVFGLPPACAWGVGVKDDDWKRSDCGHWIRLKDGSGLHNPYNFEGTGLEAHSTIPIDQALGVKWIPTGAYEHWDDANIEKCCVSKQDGCYNQETSCFIAVYQDVLLAELGLPPMKDKKDASDASWTLGAVVCSENDCLGNGPPPTCHWSEKGCLPNP